MKISQKLKWTLLKERGCIVRVMSLDCTRIEVHLKTTTFKNEIEKIKPFAFIWRATLHKWHHFLMRFSSSICSCAQIISLVASVLWNIPTWQNQFPCVASHKDCDWIRPIHCLYFIHSTIWTLTFYLFTSLNSLKFASSSNVFLTFSQ